MIKINIKKKHYIPDTFINRSVIIQSTIPCYHHYKDPSNLNLEPDSFIDESTFYNDLCWEIIYSDANCLLLKYTHVVVKIYINDLLLSKYEIIK